MTNDEFIIYLTEKFDFLRPILEEHLADNGELLPHIFMGYLTEIISNKILNKISDADIERSVIPVLSFLDRSFSYENAEIKELISVSFLENLSIDGKIPSKILELLGSSLIAELRRRDIWDYGDV